VEVARNGREATEKALSSDFDLILMDLQMPEMDGYEATSFLRTTGFDKPIFALTASMEEFQDKDRAEAGLDDFITKPFTAEIIFEKYESYLKRKGVN